MLSVERPKYFHIRDRERRVKILSKDSNIITRQMLVKTFFSNLREVSNTTIKHQTPLLDKQSHQVKASIKSSLNQTDDKTLIPDLGSVWLKQINHHRARQGWINEIIRLVPDDNDFILKRCEKRTSNKNTAKS